MVCFFHKESFSNTIFSCIALPCSLLPCRHCCIYVGHLYVYFRLHHYYTSGSVGLQSYSVEVTAEGSVFTSVVIAPPGRESV